MSSLLSGLIGSSPRVWGTRLGGPRWTDENRFIPTGVGNAISCSPIQRPGTVHPHGCGERAICLDRISAAPGSSPRVWGTRKGVTLLPRRPTVHPHGCGERLAGGALGPCADRFIPTGVGNAPTALSSKSHRAVHPHGCGERISAYCHIVVHAGSSPRVWGTLLAAAGASSVERFIPTGVGNAPTPRFRRCRRAVHPHGCGERGLMI